MTHQDWYKNQFPGVSLDNISTIDGWTGATITFGSHKGSLSKLVEFHNVTYGGAIVETDAEKLIRYKNEITVANALSFSKSTELIKETISTKVSLSASAEAKIAS